MYDFVAMLWTEFFLCQLLLIQHLEFEYTAHSVLKVPAF